MLYPNDEVVVIRLGQKKEDPRKITVSCPDKLGLACDLSRVIFEFGLSVVRADLSTDGKWCYVIFWVMPIAGSAQPIRWALLKKRLVSTCPPNSATFYYAANQEPKPKQVYLLHTCFEDQFGLLNNVSQLLWEMDLTIIKGRFWTMPDRNLMYLFYITDNRELLHTETRKDEVCYHVKTKLGQSSAYCKLWLTTPEFGGLNCTATTLSPSVIEDMFNYSGLEPDIDFKSVGSGGKLDSFSMVTDNNLSPSHTLIQILCKDRNGLLYDLMRTLKDYNIQVSYGRLSRNVDGNCEVDLFFSQADGRKILDPKKQDSLCFSLKTGITHPLRVMFVDRGSDTELLVAAPIERCGRGRPRVLYDVTRILKILNFGIFMVDFGRNVIGDYQWEVFRFLLIDRQDLSLKSIHSRSQIAEWVRDMLMR